MYYYAIIICGQVTKYLRFESTKVRELVCFAYLKSGYQAGYIHEEEIPKDTVFFRFNIGDGLAHDMSKGGT